MLSRITGECQIEGLFAIDDFIDVLTGFAIELAGWLFQPALLFALLPAEGFDLE